MSTAHVVLSQSSAPIKFTVKRTELTQPPAPSVLEATDNTLAPIDARNGATVRVEYPGMQISDMAAVSWMGGSPTRNWDSEQKSGSITGQVDFTAPASVVAACQGSVVQVSYAVVRNGQILSLPLDLTVGELALGDLPTPAIAQADPVTGTLDLTSFTGNASATVAAWPLIATGQRFWVRIDGMLEDGSDHHFYAANAQAVSEPEVGPGLKIAVLRTDLEKLKHDSPLSLTVSVTFDGASDEALAKAFTTQTYTFKNLVVVTPAINSVKNDKNQEVPNGSSSATTTLTLSGTSMANQSLEIRNGAAVLDTQTANASGAWTSKAISVTAQLYALKVYGMYGDIPESNLWTVQVQAVIPPLTIDTTPVTLNGAIIRDASVPTNPPANSFVVRTASGGTPPYRYTAQNPAIVNINETSGKVISLKSGSTNIIVTDQAGRTAQYSVTCSNIQLLFGLGSFGAYTTAVQHAANQGGRIPSVSEWNSARNNGAASSGRWCWTSNASGLRQVAIVPVTGQQEARNKNTSSDGWGIKAN